MTHDEFLLSLPHHVVPAPEQLDAGRMRRRWTARTHAPVSLASTDVSHDIEDEVRAAVDAQYASSVHVEVRSRCYPRIDLTLIDHHHLWIVIEGPDATVGVGDAVVFVEWGVLSRLDKRFPFEELQGLPRKCWALYLPS